METTFRNPTVRDAAAITHLIREGGGLDVNSHYAQLLLCHHFRDTCVLAERDSEIVGFVSGYRPPTARDVIFVWQVAVSSGMRGKGIAGQMLADLARRAVAAGCRFLEATVTPSNQASRSLFQSFAQRHGAELRRTRLFPAELFVGAEPHEPEDLFRIGPLPITTSTRR
jgi:L-2,4-diaminobutyric acid acetyltransferase